MELAVTFAIVGSVAAVAIPAFFRELHASKLSEPMEGLGTVAEHAQAFALAHDVPHAYPPSAPLTPSEVPRGVRAVDPPGAWEQPTWKALDFRAAPDGVPHAFAFEFDSTLGAARSSFVASAHGDLDGDGVTSTFEVRGHDEIDAGGPVLEPGTSVEKETE